MNILPDGVPSPMYAPESKADLTIGAGSHTCRIPTHPFPSGRRLCNDDAQDSAAAADPSDGAASDQAIGLARHEEARGFLENRRRSDICDAGCRGAEPQRVMSFVPLHDNTTPIQTGFASSLCKTVMPWVGTHNKKGGGELKKV